MFFEPLHPSTRQYVTTAQIAREYDRHFADLALFRYDAAVLDEWFQRPGHLLDLGCGTGRHLVQFARRGFDCVGVDLSGHMLDVARGKLQQAGLKARLLQADLSELERVDLQTPGQFDYALCMFSTLGLIQGGDNRQRFLDAVGRLLRPGGQLALHAHNYYYNLWSHEGRWFLLTNRLRRALGRAEHGDKVLSYYRGIRNMFIHVFTDRELQQLVAEAGLDVQEFVYLNGPRTGALRPGRWARYRANGFFVRARRPG